MIHSRLSTISVNGKVMSLADLIPCGNCIHVDYSCEYTKYKFDLNWIEVDISNSPTFVGDSLIMMNKFIDKFGYLCTIGEYYSLMSTDLIMSGVIL